MDHLRLQKISEHAVSFLPLFVGVILIYSLSIQPTFEYIVAVVTGIAVLSVAIFFTYPKTYLLQNFRQRLLVTLFFWVWMFALFAWIGFIGDFVVNTIVITAWVIVAYFWFRVFAYREAGVEEKRIIWGITRIAMLFATFLITDTSFSTRVIMHPSLGQIIPIALGSLLVGVVMLARSIDQTSRSLWYVFLHMFLIGQVYLAIIFWPTATYAQAFTCMVVSYFITLSLEGIFAQKLESARHWWYSGVVAAMLVVTLIATKWLY